MTQIALCTATLDERFAILIPNVASHNTRNPPSQALVHALNFKFRLPMKMWATNSICSSRAPSQNSSNPTLLRWAAICCADLQELKEHIHDLRFSFDVGSIDQYVFINIPLMRYLFFFPSLLFSRKMVLGCRVVFYWAASRHILFLFWPVSRCAFGREGVSPDLPLPGAERIGRGVEDLRQGCGGGEVFKQKTGSERRGCCMGKESRPAGFQSKCGCSERWRAGAGSGMRMKLDASLLHLPPASMPRTTPGPRFAKIAKSTISFAKGIISLRFGNPHPPKPILTLLGYIVRATQSPIQCTAEIPRLKTHPFFLRRL